MWTRGKKCKQKIIKKESRVSRTETRRERCAAIVAAVTIYIFFPIFFLINGNLWRVTAATAFTRV